MPEMPAQLRRAVAEYRRTHPPSRVYPRPADSTITGDVVLVASDNGQDRAVWYVSRIHTEPFRYFTGMLCTNMVEYATEADWITHAAPYRLVVQGELYGTVSCAQIVQVIAHAGVHKHHLWDLDGHDEHGRPFLPLGGIDDQRRAFKSAELERHNAFVLGTRRRLLDGM